MTDLQANKIDYEYDKDFNLVLKFSITKSYVNSAKQLIDDMANVEKIQLSVSKAKKRRSLNANSYLWILIGKLAERAKLTSADVYRHYIRLAGAYDVHPFKKEVFERFSIEWSKLGLGYQTEVIGTDKKGNVEALLYYGSSCYSSEQFNKVLDMVVEDCKQEGIETMTPQELEALKER